MQLGSSFWVFVLGCCFGSFLNVVIYRLPAGMSLGHPKSRCPRCETSLAARDNIPVLGWLLLRGKCRYCSLPIAARYPLVEAACGCLLISLFFGGLLRGGMNLPTNVLRHNFLETGFWLLAFREADLVGIFAYHGCLLIVLLATMMIGIDRHLPQRKLMIFGLSVGLIAGTLWPVLRPVAAWPGAAFDLWRSQWGIDIQTPWRARPIWFGMTLQGLLDGVFGCLGGLLVGSTVRFSVSRCQKFLRPTRKAIVAGFVLLGCYLGWQAAVILGVLYLLPMVMLVLFSVRRQGGSDWIGPLLVPLALAFILFWGQIVDLAVFAASEGFNWTPFSWCADWLLQIGSLFLAAAILRKLTAIDIPAEPEPAAPGPAAPGPPTPAPEQSLPEEQTTDEEASTESRDDFRPAE